MAREKITFRFDMSNPRAESIINRLAGRYITRLMEDVRQAVRQAILSGYSEGQHPFQIALDLVGRIGASGRREGGLIGMTAPQEKASANFYRKLLEGDSDVFNYELRDKRFDSTIRSAFEEDGGVSVDKATKMYERYIDNALKLRGETVARSETGKAVHAATQEAFAQGLEKTGYTKDAVYKVWRTAGDKKVRDSHEEMDGQVVVGLDTPFISGDGAQLRFPLDSDLGAGPGDIINCRCDVEMNIDFSQGIDLSEGAADVPATRPRL